jgi:hypothetical protein
MRGSVFAVTILACLLARPSVASADDCRFTVSESVMRLEADCTTTASIEIPDGFTLDGNFHRIVAVSSREGTFAGGVVVGRGQYASIINTSIAATVPGGCTSGPNRLRGIYFEGASGLIRNNVVQDIHRGVSPCEDGHAIEVRNGNARSPSRVEVEDNIIERYQKSALVVHGHVIATIRGNRLGPSVSQEHLAANTIQVGPGAQAQVERNIVAGNRSASSLAAGTAILLIGSADGTVVRANQIVGNADVGIYVMADGAIVEANELSDEGIDGFYDIGIADVGVRNGIIGNTIQGFRTRILRMDHPPAPSGGQQIE